MTIVKRKVLHSNNCIIKFYLHNVQCVIYHKQLYFLTLGLNEFCICIKHCSMYLKTIHKYWDKLHTMQMCRRRYDKYVHCNVLCTKLRICNLLYTALYLLYLLCRNVCRVMKFILIICRVFYIILQYLIQIEVWPKCNVKGWGLAKSNVKVLRLLKEIFIWWLI